MTIEIKILESAVKSAVGRYARKLWRLDVRDLTQEAWMAALEARAKFDPARGTDPWTWTYRTICWALREYGVQTISAVRPPRNAPMHAAGATPRKAANGSSSFSWVDATPRNDRWSPEDRGGGGTGIAPSFLETVPDPGPSPAEALEDAQLKRIAVQAVREALDAVDPRVRPILACEATPEQVAARLGLERGEVYRAAEKARRIVKADKQGVLARARNRIGT